MHRDRIEYGGVDRTRVLEVEMRSFTVTGACKLKKVMIESANEIGMQSVRLGHLPHTDHTLGHPVNYGRE